MLAQGVAPRVVMEVLGHSQISLTMNTYARVSPALGRSAAATLDALVAASSTERAGASAAGSGAGR